MSEDRRRKEWIVFGTPDGRQLGKIVKKKKKKVLIEHWQMQSNVKELATEINRCAGCTREEEQMSESCQQWIRISNKINVIPETLIKKDMNRIKIATDQIIENMKMGRAENREQKLEGPILVEDLKVEIIKRQKIRDTISKKITEILRRNLIRNKNKYIIYTDGALNTKAKEEAPGRDNIGIG